MPLGIYRNTVIRAGNNTASRVRIFFNINIAAAIRANTINFFYTNVNRNLTIIVNTITINSARISFFDIVCSKQQPLQ